MCVPTRAVSTNHHKCIHAPAQLFVRLCVHGACVRSRATCREDEGTEGHNYIGHNYMRGPAEKMRGPKEPPSDWAPERAPWILPCSESSTRFDLIAEIAGNCNSPNCITTEHTIASHLRVCVHACGRVGG